MAEFRVHHIRFYNYIPKAIHCISYEDTANKIALSRSDGSIEVWSVTDNWMLERVIPPTEGHSVEALLWCGKRLFSAGLSGDLIEYDLIKLQPKTFLSSNSGAIWCLALNQEKNCIAAGTEDGCIVLYEITEDGVHYKKSPDRQEGRILSIAWDHQDSSIVTGGIDNIRIWSVSSGHAIQRLTMGRQDRNKETIVWCIAVTRDFTIISGDSRGKVCFWNGKHGTLIKNFQSHNADVLSLCVNKEGTSVFCSGIDPTMVQFEFTSTREDSDWKMWVRSSSRTIHTHDVRALAFVGNSGVASGGVDCRLIFNPVEKHQWKLCKKIPAVQQRGLVHLASQSHLIVLRYDDYLEIWKLGETNKKSDKNGDILALKTNPLKLLQLKSKGGEHIVCCGISPGGDWLIYSDQTALRLFRLNIEEIEVASPRVAMNRVKKLPHGILPAHCVTFTPDGTRVVTATVEGSLQVISLESDIPSPQFTLQSPTVPQEPIHLLAVSHDGRYLATGDHSNNVHIYDLNKQKHTCSLPKYQFQPTALTFHPNNRYLVAVYSDRKIFEYDVDQQEYTKWSRQNIKQFHPHWLKKQGIISHVRYNPQNQQQLVLHDDQMLCVLDKSQHFPKPEEKLLQTRKVDQKESEQHAFHICSKYKYILHCDVLGDDWMVIVEQPPMVMMEALPPTLKQKKFGT